MNRDRLDEASAPLEVEVVGIGFGPANLALAVALKERGYAGGSGDSAGLDATPGAPTALFLEANEATTWHEGMLFESSSLQVSFAKDLVSFRDPTSPYSFMNFLVESGRVHDFFNRGSLSPLRIEFVAYLRWAAERLREWVSYGEKVELVTPLVEDGEIVGYHVRSRLRDGNSRTRRARHVVVAAGLQPRLPGGFPEDPRAFHSAHYLERIGTLGPVKTAVVLGGGQSAAEVALETHRRFPQAAVHLVHSRFGLIPSDATPFANRIFDNDSVDVLYGAPEQVRERMGMVHANTNNSVVHAETLQEFYDAWYVGSWTEQRLVMHDASRATLTGVDSETGGLSVEVLHELDGSRQQIQADLVVAGTGYTPQDPGDFLGEHAGLLERDEQGHVEVDRDYGVRWTMPARGRLFAVGSTQHRHGVSATLLSNIALRAGEIAAALGSDTDAVPLAQAWVEAGGTLGRARVETALRSLYPTADVDFSATDAVGEGLDAATARVGADELRRFAGETAALQCHVVRGWDAAGSPGTRLVMTAEAGRLDVATARLIAAELGARGKHRNALLRFVSPHAATQGAAQGQMMAG